VQEQRTHLIAAAYNQFRQFGFKAVTMDDIARHSGVSKKTLYELFTDKDELVLESIRHMLHENQCHTDEVFRTSKHAVEQIVHILVQMEKMVRGMNPVCYVDLQRHYPEAYKYLNTHKETYLYQCISENLRQGIDEGLYRPDINIPVISRFRMESALIVFQYNLFPQDTYDIVEVNKQIFAHYMYGIASLKGHKLISSYLKKYSK
jgi:AcrR family transcriptional regulator